MSIATAIGSVIDSVFSFIQNGGGSRPLSNSTAMKNLGNLVMGKDYFKLNESIAKAAKKNIAHFPMLMSSSIPDDQVFKLAESVERTIADMLLLCIQNTGNLIDLQTDSDAKRKFINSFTQGGKHGMDADSIVDAGARYASEAVILQKYGSFFANIDDEPITNSFEMSTLFNPTLKAYTDNSDEEEELEMGAVAPVSGRLSGETTYPHENNDEDGEDFGNEEENASEAAGDNNPPPHPQRGNNRPRRCGNEVKKIEEKQYRFQPTIVNATVLMQTNTDTLETNVAFGIKTNVHILDGSSMVEAIKDTYSDSSLITRIIRWRSGELSFVKDVLLNLKEIKKTVAARNKKFNMNSPKGIFATMRFNASNAVAMNTVATRDGKILPTVIVVLTMDEVEAIKNACGKDIFKRMTDARELCDKLALFGLILIDSANDTFYSFFNDGDTMYTKASFKDKKSGKDDEVIRAVFGALKR